MLRALRTIAQSCRKIKLSSTKCSIVPNSCRDSNIIPEHCPLTFTPSSRKNSYRFTSFLGGCKVLRSACLCVWLSVGVSHKTRRTDFTGNFPCVLLWSALFWWRCSGMCTSGCEDNNIIACNLDSRE